MKGFSAFFINRPVFAAVLSIIIFTVGAIAIPLMPVSEYPDAIPPTVNVTATYPGANPKVIAETVATPLEEAINGVDNMLYMKSVASSDGVMQLTVTFEHGTDVDIAQVQVQNRVSQALSRLPQAVRDLGVPTQKSSPSITLFISLLSPDKSYDTLYMRNYALLHLKDELARIKGVGDVQLFGSGDYAMRVWLDPDKLASRNLTASDVVAAIRQQNVQVAAGQLGAPPQRQFSEETLLINAKGRLESPEEFGNIILKTATEGGIVKLADVARMELGATSYSMRNQINGVPSVEIAVFQAPGANAIAISNDVHALMTRLEASFPEGLSWVAAYDPTNFVQESIRSVINTLLEAVLLVVVIVVLFLQTWRASVIPLLAVPVSIVGSFAVLHLLGMSINTLTLFGMVLAIGIVVDDAIVVVENVERHIHDGMAPKDAALKAMQEVSGPIVAITLVISAVFIPMSFLSGVTGQFYNQFAIAIVVSTLISAFNSLTLSPALAAVLLPARNSKPDKVTVVMNRLLGGIFIPFNRFFNRASSNYSGLVSRSLKRPLRSLLLYGVILTATVAVFWQVPGGFIPVQDKMYLIGGIKMPEGASLDRVEQTMTRMEKMALETEGVKTFMMQPGLNAMQFSLTPNTGTAWIILEDFANRTRSAEQITDELSQKFATINEGFAYVIMPPPILGLGTGSGYSLYLQDKTGQGFGVLQNSTNMLAGALSQEAGFSFPISSFQANIPQLNAVIDRQRAYEQGISVTDIFETLQIYLGSAYANDFNQFGRTFQVNVQAEPEYRRNLDTLSQLKTRNARGEMVPLGSLVTFEPTYGPDPVIRYNGYPAADMMGETDSSIVSSAQAMQKVTAMAQQILPAGIEFEWTDLSYQQFSQGKAALIVFPLSLLLVYLVLAALYESWALPLSVILIVPLAAGAALVGTLLCGGDNNVFVQIGLVVLMGLACKNAILIVEFARDAELQGKSAMAAAIEAAHLRLRPIIMTSLAFIAGVIPLIISSGAGAEIRSATGIAVFSGMIGVTALGLFLTPVFYVMVRRQRQINISTRQSLLPVAEN